MPAKFLNFDLELARYEKSPSGQVSFRVRASHTPRDQVQLEDQADLVSIPGGFTPVLNILKQRWQPANKNDQARACRSIGDWLLPPKSTALSLFLQSLAALSDAESLFLRLRCRHDELARVPWEFATVDLGQQDDGRFHVNRTLVAHPKVCVVRYEEIRKEIERSQRARGVARIFFVSAQPKDSRELALAVERERIEDALKQCQPAPTIEWLDHATAADLQKRLMGSRFDVFQFSGHGGSSQGGVLEFEDAKGELAELGADKLGILLAGKGVSVAVLAACATAEIELEFPWTGVARALVEAGVPAVVGMQLRIVDKTAVAFLSMFYRALASGLSIGDALIEGRKAICIDPECELDFGVPVLYLRSGENWDTVLFPTTSASAHVQEGSLEADIRAAYGYKTLHDRLHRAKYDAFYLILEFLRDFPPKGTRDRDALKSYKNQLDLCAQDMQPIRAEGRCAPELIEPLIASFNQGLARFEKALSDWDRDAFEDSIVRFDSVFGREMSKLDTCLLAKINELPPSEEIAELLAVDPIRATKFTQMIAEMRQLVTRHHACQLLQDRLDDLQDGAEVDARRISEKWKKVVDKVLATFIDALDQQAVTSLTKQSEKLRVTLDTSDAESVASAYQEFRGQADKSFFRVDTDLKNLCAKLNNDL